MKKYIMKSTIQTSILMIYYLSNLLSLYLYPYFYALQYIQFDSYIYLTDNENNFNVIDFDNYSPFIETIISGIIIGFKACIMIFIFI